MSRQQTKKNRFLARKKARSAKNFFAEHSSDDDDNYDDDAHHALLMPYIDDPKKKREAKQIRKAHQEFLNCLYRTTFSCCGGNIETQTHYCKSCGKPQHYKTHLCMECEAVAERIEEQKIRKQQKPTLVGENPLVRENPFYVLSVE